MKRALFISLLVLSACGRDEVREDELALQQSLTGTYEFGPMVGKGLPPADDTIQSPSARLASLELKADGTFEMNFGMGCVLNFASGSWKMVNASAARLELSQHSGWTDANGRELRLTTVDATLSTDGLVITGTSNRGALSQNWEAAR